MAATAGVLVGFYLHTAPYGNVSGWSAANVSFKRPPRPPVQPISATVPQPVPAQAPKPAPPPTPRRTVATTASQSAATLTEIASLSVCPTQNDPAAAVQALICLTNNARKYHGRGAVASNAQLSAAAGSKASDMQSCGYSHTACGRPADYWLDAHGYSGNCSGENIAQGQKTPRDVFVDWMNSSGHKQNILNPSYRDIGIATALGSKGTMWVMELGGC